jgi:small conductance mechanosensitive channel
MTITLDDVLKWADLYLVPIGIKILFALVILLVGLWITRAILRALDRVMERSDMDVSLRKFLGDVSYAVLFVVVVIASLDSLGVKTTAVVAVLGAAGLAIGLALQGSLSNFAAGVMLIVLRPYKVGDIVTIGKYSGRVDAIRVFHTLLITSDFREVTIPNGVIIAQPIENLTVLGRRRVDFVVSVAQSADLARVRTLLEGIAVEHEQIDNHERTAIEIAEITDASVKLYFRPWTNVDTYTKVATETMELIKQRMESAGLKYSVTLQVPAA